MFTQTPYDFALNVFDFFLFEVRVVTCDSDIKFKVEDGF